MNIQFIETGLTGYYIGEDPVLRTINAPIMSMISKRCVSVFYLQGVGVLDSYLGMHSNDEFFLKSIYEIRYV